MTFLMLRIVHLIILLFINFLHTYAQAAASLSSPWDPYLIHTLDPTSAEQAFTFSVIYYVFYNNANCLWIFSCDLTLKLS